MIFMGRNVLATFKIMPESPEVDLHKLKEEIRNSSIGQIKDIKEEPIGFGLVALKVLALVSDEGGLIEEIEQKLAKLKGVQTAENEGVTLV